MKDNKQLRKAGAMGVSILSVLFAIIVCLVVLDFYIGINWALPV